MCSSNIVYSSESARGVRVEKCGEVTQDICVDNVVVNYLCESDMPSSEDVRQIYVDNIRFYISLLSSSSYKMFLHFILDMAGNFQINPSGKSLVSIKTRDVKHSTRMDQPSKSANPLVMNMETESSLKFHIVNLDNHRKRRILI